MAVSLVIFLNSFCLSGCRLPGKSFFSFSSRDGSLITGTFVAIDKFKIFYNTAGTKHGLIKPPINFSEPERSDPKSLVEEYRWDLFCVSYFLFKNENTKLR